MSLDESLCYSSFEMVNLARYLTKKCVETNTKDICLVDSILNDDILKDSKQYIITEDKSNKTVRRKVIDYLLNNGILYFWNKNNPHDKKFITNSNVVINGIINSIVNTPPKFYGDKKQNEVYKLIPTYINEKLMLMIEIIDFNIEDTNLIFMPYRTYLNTSENNEISVKEAFKQCHDNIFAVSEIVYKKCNGVINKDFCIIEKMLKDSYFYPIINTYFGLDITQLNLTSDYNLAYNLLLNAFLSNGLIVQTSKSKNKTERLITKSIDYLDYLINVGLLELDKTIKNIHGGIPIEIKETSNNSVFKLDSSRTKNNFEIGKYSYIPYVLFNLVQKGEVK